MEGLARGRAAAPRASLGAGTFQAGRPPSSRALFSRKQANALPHTHRNVPRRRGSAASWAATRAQAAGGNSTPSCREESPPTPKSSVENLVIIGSGPAGYTAAIYAARANLHPLVFEGYQVGGSPGGQLMTTGEVENFPGFPAGISGPDLMDLMRRQAERWGARMVTEDVVGLDLSSHPYAVTGTDTAVLARSVIVATGATARRLGLPSETQYWGVGISACAICDGASPQFRGKDLVVVGGGDTAVEEALYLTKFGARVHLLVRSARMRASAAMQQRVRRAPRVELHLNTETVDVVGDGRVVTGVRVRDRNTATERIIPAGGLFYGIGHVPNSSLFTGAVELDAGGYVVPSGPGGATSVPGIFAAGDLQDHEWRQAVTAAGSGCASALAAERWLAGQGYLDDEEAVRGEGLGGAEAWDGAGIPPDGVTAGTGAGVPASTTAVGSSKVAAAGAGVSGNGASTAAPSRPYRGTPLGAAELFDPTATRHQGQYALRRLYHEWPGLLAVMYTAPTCAPCRTVKPILRSVVDELTGAVKLVEIDIEDDPEIAQAAGVSSTPTLQLFRGKERLLHQPGVKMKREYRALLEKYLEGTEVAEPAAKA